METARRLIASLGLLLIAHSTAWAGQVFNAITPCRLIDTRQSWSEQPAYVGQQSPPPSPPGSTQPLPRGQWGFTVRGQMENCNIDENATAITFNVTSANSTSNGYFGLYPGDTNFSSYPLALWATVNFTAGVTRGNGGVVALAETGSYDLAVEFVTALAGSQTSHLILDLTGYYTDE